MQVNRSTALRLIVLSLASLQTVTIAQTEAAHTRFEVASVRPSKGNVFRRGPLTVADPLIRLEGYTVFGLLMDAYHVRDFQLKLSAPVPPEDIVDRMYDIVARTPGAGTPKIEDVRVMLQNLLADRFHLQVHHETKVMPVYALTVVRESARLKASASAAECSVRTRLASDGRNNQETFAGCPIERLADVLRNLTSDRPVLDETGLGGRYDFQLVAIPQYRARGGSDPADIDPIAAVAELGLKLVSKRAPVDMIVVDHLERPAEN